MRLVQVLDMMINKVREIQLWKRSLLRNISLGYLIWRKKVGMINVVLNLPRLDVAVYRDQAVYNNNDKDILKSANFIKRNEVSNKRKV
mgnify:CR=1 FL=1